MIEIWPEMTAYIEIVGAVAMRRHNLSAGELREIGPFTRGNVLMWLDNQRSLDWVGYQPVRDIHAVCGDIDIPWATEDGKQIFSRISP